MYGTKKRYPQRKYSETLGTTGIMVRSFVDHHADERVHVLPGRLVYERFFSGILQV